MSAPMGGFSACGEEVLMPGHSTGAFACGWPMSVLCVRRYKWVKSCLRTDFVVGPVREGWPWLDCDGVGG